jgi:hypothetical protein
MIDWPAATMIGGAIVLAGALGYTAYRHFSEPWLVQGTWEPAEPAWPRPTLRFVAEFSSLATTTSEDWGFTPSRYFLERGAPA